RAPAFAAVGGLDRDPLARRGGRVDGRVPDRLDPGEDLADRAALALVAPVVLVGEQAGDVHPGRFGEVERPRHVEALGDDDGVVNVEDRAGADHRRPGVEARVVLEDVFRLHTVADERLAPRVRLVVGPGVVVAGDEDLADLAGVPEQRRLFDAVGEHAAHVAVRVDQGAGDDRDFGGRHVGDFVG